MAFATATPRSVIGGQALEIVLHQRLQHPITSGGWAREAERDANESLIMTLGRNARIGNASGFAPLFRRNPEDGLMKIIAPYSAAMFILLTVPAAAQDKKPTVQPNELTVEVQKKPPLQLSEQQRVKIQDALVTAHSAQKTPDKFVAKVGDQIPTKLKLDAMPAPLINQEPVLKQYDFVKLDNELLVVDPMNKTIVAVIPRKFPKEPATQGSAPSGQTNDPASHGDEAETTKKD
jgi:hypothetical protein